VPAFDPGLLKAEPEPEVSLVERLTPELVLVSPELAAAARAALPDRPWEAFSRPTLGSIGLVVPSEPELRLPAFGGAAEQIPPTWSGTDTRGRRRRRGRTAARAAAVLVGVSIGGVLLVGSLPWVPNGPTLGEAATPVPLRAIGSPGGGYSYRGLIRLRLGDSGREVAELAVASACGEAVIEGPISLGPGGQFRVTVRRGDLAVDVVATSVSESAAEGRLRVRRPGCDTGQTPFVALLS
jgi:hypothetical protein